MNKEYYGWGLPIDVSTHGWEVDRLIVVIHWVMFALFAGWLIFLVYSLFRFRARADHKAEYHTKHFRLPTYLEAAVAITEAVLLCAFSFPIWRHYTQEMPPLEKSLRVRVVAEQFAWNVHYPGADGVFGKADPKLMGAANPLGLDPDDPAGADDVATINQLQIPVDTPVIVELTSKDVIHSFALPVARVKQDAIPGQAATLWFEAVKTGEFEIACAQLCGLGHYRMRGFFTVLEKDQYDAWMAEQVAQKAPAEAALETPAPTTETP
jgi:cytochrome c oxidase subunit 2